MPGRAEFHESWGWCQHAKFGEQLRYEESPRAQYDHTLFKTNREVDVKVNVWLRKSIEDILTLIEERLYEFSGPLFPQMTSPSWHLGISDRIYNNFTSTPHRRNRLPIESSS